MTAENTDLIIDLSDRTDMFYWQTNRKISAQQTKDIFLDRHRAVKREDAIAAIEYGMHEAGKSKSDSKVERLDSPIKFGSVNSVFRATLADGTKIVVRMHPYNVKNGYFWVESVATKKAKEFGVPVFETYFIDDSQKKFNFDFMIMEAISGKVMQDMWPIDAKLDKILIEETGKYAALIHKVKPKGFGFFQNGIAKEKGELQGQYRKFSEHVYAGFDEDLDFLTEQKVFSFSQRKKVEKIFSDSADLMKCNDPVLVHNDIADWNQLSNGKHITGMMDWDECFSGDPVLEFSAWSLFFDNKRLRHFIRGYKQVGELPEGYKEKERLFKLRYLISKMHLRKKRLLVVESKFLEERLKHAVKVMKEEFRYFGV